MNFLSQIQTIVAAIFTNALGYDATFRADFADYLNTNIVTLVDPTAPTNEVSEAWQQALADSVYGPTVGPTKERMDEACEETVNLAIAYYTSSGIPGAKLAILQCSLDAGTGDLVINRELMNTIGVISGNSHAAAGVFQLTFPASSFPDLNKVVVSCPHVGNEDSDVLAVVEGGAISSIKVQLQAFKATTAAAPGNTVLTVADNIFAIGTPAIIMIQVLP